jgi:hypothetical protein
MTRPLRTGFIHLTLCSALLLTLATTASSQELSGFAKEGGYAGVSGLLNFTFDGVTFDGTSAYQKVGGEEIVVLPRLDTRNVVKGILGFRAPRGAFELSYERSRHNGTFMDVAGKATFQSVNADGRFFLFTRSRIQPHVLVGAAIPWFTVDEGSFLDGEVGKARFRGYGVNSEAGVTVYVQPRVGVSIGYAYRVFWFDRATGVANEFGELRPRFRETSGNVVVTGLFTF